MVKLMDINPSDVKGITSDSREVKPGFIFVAVKGFLQDGHNYINKAIENGATIIVHQDEIKQEHNITYIKTKDTKVSLSELAKLIYPKQPEHIMGITGTNGKSSIVHFIREVLNNLDKKNVSIGTLGVLGDIQMQSSLTTPSAIDIHKILTNIANNNIKYTSIECSSHGIDQHRLDNVQFSACGFSNFTQDHLDYHHTMEQYFLAKQKLFSLMKNGHAVLNSDIPEYNRLKNFCTQNNHKIISYGTKGEDIVIKSITSDHIQQKVEWEIYGKRYNTVLNLVGNFQIYNLACAIGLLLGCKIPQDDIMRVLEKVQTVTGRMELVASHNQANIFIDYAHTPDALEHALQTLRSVTKNKLWVIFGCGGNRDVDKRTIMGKIALLNADTIIITDDNPRNEDPDKIRQDIISGCPNAENISNRGEAIKFALSKIQSGDNLLIAGKGHENYQIINDKKIHFSDKEKVLEILNLT